ncbi:MAG: dTDP-4-dehydrorhamnose reductase [Brevinematales bacterium]|jgi:dTDP-4-dehydrorhamnose reductase
MNILVTGSGGQLGSEIRKLSPGHNDNFIFTDVDDLDITDIEALDLYFKITKLDIVINCAAYTAVDMAEKEAFLARRINSDSCANIAKLSKKYGFRIIHISTDFVYNGRKNTPYVESDPTGPLSVYGRTKLEGEKHIMSAAGSYIIIRTSWLYSSFGKNFVKTMIKAAGEKPELRVVCDQTGTPTYAGDLAAAILKILPEFLPGTRQTYHYSNEGTASWYDFTVAICDLMGIKIPVKPISSSEYVSPARRPAYSVLSKEKIKKDFGLAVPYWRESLKACLEFMK